MTKRGEEDALIKTHFAAVKRATR